MKVPDDDKHIVCMKPTKFAPGGTRWYPILSAFFREHRGKKKKKKLKVCVVKTVKNCHVALQGFPVLGPAGTPWPCSSTGATQGPRKIQKGPLWSREKRSKSGGS